MYIYIYQSIHISIFLSFVLSFYLSFELSIYISIYISFYLSFFLFFLSNYLSIYLSRLSPRDRWRLRTGRCSWTWSAGTWCSRGSQGSRPTRPWRLPGSSSSTSPLVREHIMCLVVWPLSEGVKDILRTLKSDTSNIQPLTPIIEVGNYSVSWNKASVLRLRVTIQKNSLNKTGFSRHAKYFLYIFFTPPLGLYFHKKS